MKRIPNGITCLVIILALFGYLGSVMGMTNMLNTIMKTAHGLLLNTVFYLMSMCVLTGALSKILTEFGVVNLLQVTLRHVMRPLYNMPGVAVVASMMTFLSDNPAIITLSKNKQFAKYFKVYQFISLANFGTAFGMGLLVIVFMIGQGYFAAPIIGFIGAASGGIIATRLMQYFICKKYPEYRDKDAVSKEEVELLEKEKTQNENEEEKPNTFIRILNALEIEAQHEEAEGHGHQHVDHVDARVGDHLHEAQIRALAGQEHNEVVDHPAGDDGVEGHQGQVAQQAEQPVDMPFLAGLFQLLIHFDGACLGGAAHSELHDHGGQTQQHQAQDVNQHEAAAAELSGHPGELPDVAAADGTAGAEHDEAETASQSFSTVIHNDFLSFLFPLSRTLA